MLVRDIPLFFLFTFVFAILLITKHCRLVHAHANDAGRRRCCRGIAAYKDEEALHYANK